MITNPGPAWRMNWRLWRNREQPVPSGHPRLRTCLGGWTSCWLCASGREHRDIKGWLHCAGLLGQAAHDSVELSTDHTVPPLGICVCPLCAQSHCWPGLPSGSAAGWCDTNLWGLRHWPPSHCRPAARLKATTHVIPDSTVTLRECSICSVYSPECPSFFSVQWPDWITSNPSRCKGPRESFLVMWWSKLMGEWWCSSKGWHEGNVSPQE